MSNINEKDFLIDIPVALVFFNRPEPLEEVFKAIKECKPSILFLIQDGARETNKTDLINIEKCKRIVEQIDWECKVYKNYSNENLGCGMRIYSGISWCFEYVDRLCIIEDDCKPTMQFFLFAKELLEMYKDDQRVDMISGMNNLEIYSETKTSYIFSETGSIWGWATWKRAWSKIDYNLSLIDDEEAIRLLTNYIKPYRLRKYLIKEGKNKRSLIQNSTRLTSWSYQRGINMYLNSGLIIVPTKNLVSNIGLTDDSVHSVNSIKKIPKAFQKLFFMKTYDIDFPLVHPKYIIRDLYFDRKMLRLMYPVGVVRFLRKIESFIRRKIFR